MPSVHLTLVRIVLFSATIPYWLWLARAELNLPGVATCLVLGVAAAYPVVMVGRKLLDANPTQGQMQWVTTWVHFLLLLILGTSLVVAISNASQSRGWLIPIDQRISLSLMVVTGLLAFASVINLALRGWGAPFAVALSRRLATDWMYAWTRNPMVLTTLVFLVALGLWFQSLLFVLWVLLWLTPWFVYFLKVFEERELQIRLGNTYLKYRTDTPFLWPRRPRP